MKQHHHDYFEGILQIRNPNKELLEWIRNRVMTEKRAFISKEKTVKNGIDLYMSSQHYLQNLGKQLQEKFNGILKTSKRLHTVDKMTSKLLYRVNVLFKPFPFKRGDIITLHGEQVQIMQIGKRVQVKNIQTGKKAMVPIELLVKRMRYSTP
ncbi:MAG TPA: NMD3-related protein [Candidatus Nanoarchaeia archaeon]|nr:NMD3-related protein [Candidatus Nanoarchaeia archaeon]